MENLSKNQLYEINAGGGKEIYSIVWLIITAVAKGGNIGAIKTAGLAASEQFECLEIIFNYIKGSFI